MFRSWIRPSDVILNMQVGDVTNDIMRMLRVTRKTGQKLGPPYSKTNKTELSQLHAVAANLKLAQSFLLQVDFSQSVPRLYPPAITTELLNKKGLTPQQFFVLNPGNSHVSRGKSKNHRAWPTTHWRELIARLGQHPIHYVVTCPSQERGLSLRWAGRYIMSSVKVLIYCAPGEEALVEALGEQPDNVIMDNGSPVMDLITYLDQCALLVSSDTGTVDLAAALNTPIIGLYGPTNELNTVAYPIDKHIFRIAHTDIHCQPCINTSRYKICTIILCMKYITPERVFKEINNVIS